MMNTSAYRSKTGSLPFSLTTLAIALLIAFAATIFSPSKAYAASDVYLTDGTTYNLSEVKSATRLHANSGGTITIKGSSSKTMLIAAPPAGQTINIIFDNVTLTPNTGAPGFPLNSRSAITIEESGGTVNLISKAGTTSTFKAYRNLAAIRKDGTRTRLGFQTTDPANPGTIKAYASTSAYRTCAIGCYSKWWTILGANTTGNMFFESGNVEAYGSRGTTGGPGIGADCNGSVDGITFCGANVTAVGGDTSCAAIGTSSSGIPLLTSGELPPTDEPTDESPAIRGDDPDLPTGDFFHGATCKNITISAGSVTATHYASEVHGGGAGIGGGRGTSASNITISGGTVKAEGGASAAGIGGGSDGDGINIRISGGTVNATGDATGIGGGYAEGIFDGQDKFRYGDATVYISGGTVDAAGRVGIGGWKGERGNGEIIITGGTVNARSTSDGAGIGGGYIGTMARINISGGDIIAQGGEREVAIGTTITGDPNSICKSINISGGNITAHGGAKANADIGGFSSTGHFNRNPTPVYISGGNVRAPSGAFKTTPEQYAGGPRVYLNKIKLETFDDTVPKDTIIKVNDLGIQTGTSAYSYNTNNMKLFTDDTELWLWLPENASVSSATLDRSYTKSRITERFLGATSSSQGGNGTLYPAINLTLRGRFGGTTDGSAHAGQGMTTVSDFVPATWPGHTVNFYATDAGGNTTLIYPDGILARNVSNYTDAEGRWIATTRQSYNNGVDVFTQWIPITYRVAFDSNKPDGASTKISGTTATKDCTWGQPTPLTPCGFSLPGYTFTGWNTQPDGTGTSYSDGASVHDLTDVNGSTVTLYAQWQARTYDVIFDGNGADSGTMSAQTMIFDQPTPLALNAFAKSGNTFLGWGHNSFGSLYENAAIVCNLCDLDTAGIPTGKTLSATWAEDGQATLIITNNGEPVQGLEAPGLLKIRGNGSEFTGFTTDATKPGVYTLGSATSPLPAGTYDIVLAPSTGFESGGKTVTVKSGGTGTATLAYCTVEIVAEPHANAWVREKGTTRIDKVLIGSQLKIGCSVDEGFVFESYTAQLQDPLWENNDPTAANQTITVQGKTVIEAHPRAARYSISFNANGSTDTMPNQDMAYDEQQNLFTCTLQREGYTFAGWTESPAWEGKLYTDGELIDNPLTSKDGETVTLYAQWNPNPYFIHFNDNGALGLMLDEKAYFDSPTKLIPNEYVRENWHFIGWNTDPQGNGTAYEDEAEVINLFEQNGDEVTLYAQWERDTYTIHFEANGGTGTMVNQIAFTNLDQQLSNVAFSRENYQFTGWNTSPDGSGTAYTNAAVVNNLTATGNTITLYAQWKHDESPKKDDPDNKDENHDGTSIPKTGDTPALYLFIMTGLSSLALMLLAKRFNRRRL